MGRIEAAQWTSPDLICLILSALVLLGYHLYLWRKIRQDPAYSIQAVNRQARAAWVAQIMQDGKKDVLAIQTLRNSMMGAIFLATEAVLLIIGTLTLSGLGSRVALSGAFHLSGVLPHDLWIAKLLLLLLAFFVAFFSFSQAVRVFNHVGYMINLPAEGQGRIMTPAQVASHLNRGGYYYSIGMRAYYLSVPLVFWLFGPYYLLGATIGLTLVLYRLDQAPELKAG